MSSIVFSINELAFFLSHRWFAIDQQCRALYLVTISAAVELSPDVVLKSDFSGTSPSLIYLLLLLFVGRCFV